MGRTILMKFKDTRNREGKLEKIRKKRLRQIREILRMKISGKIKILEHRACSFCGKWVGKEEVS